MGICESNNTENQPTFGTNSKTGIQPTFNLISKGSGITNDKQNEIVSSAMSIVQNGLTPIGQKTGLKIKEKLGGDWLILIHPKDKYIDFNITLVKGNDYMTFNLDNNKFHVIRI